MPKGIPGSSTTGICDIEGCEKPMGVGRRRLCYMHYSRWRKYGDTSFTQRPTGRLCSVDGCGAPHHARGRCATHSERRYRQQNPGANAERLARRKAQKLATQVVPVTQALLAAKWRYWAGRCWICGTEATQWDHVKPLARGGSHILANLRPACAPCNNRKRARWPL